MKGLFVLMGIFLAGEIFAEKIEVPSPTADGYVNPNGRFEYKYEVYPEEKIWHEFGRPYWKQDPMSKMAKELRPKKKIVVRRTFDFDNDRDQYPRTLKNVTGNVFGRAVDGKVNINLAVRFANGKAIINREYSSKIDQLANVMKEHKTLKIQIQGHSDSRGNRIFNIQLSKKRAEAVKNYLATEHGISIKRLETRGFGPDRPLASNSSYAGQKKNRRVEAIVLPNEN